MSERTRDEQPESAADWEQPSFADASVPTAGLAHPDSQPSDLPHGRLEQVVLVLRLLAATTLLVALLWSPQGASGLALTALLTVNVALWPLARLLRRQRARLVGDSPRVLR